MEKTIRELIKKSMLEKNKNASTTYKNILETAQKKAKETRAEVTDDMIVSAAKTEIKQLNDLLAYVKEGDEKYSEIMEKLGYCENVLPKMASEEEMTSFLVENAVEKNIGACMKAMKSHFGSTLNGSVAQVVATKYIAE